MANKKQLNILKQGVDTWNHWRSKEESVKINLTSSNLEGVDLQGVNFHKANLRGANLNSANLRNADLGGAYLRNAEISQADLSEVELSGADLVNTNLRESDLKGADFTGANLRSADLFEANLSGANFSLADLSYANLNQSELQDANFTETNFHRTTLDGIDLASLNLSQGQISQIEEHRTRIDVTYEMYSRLKANNDIDQEFTAPKITKVNDKKNVFFTAYHPIKGKTENWHTLLVYAHTPSLLARVRKDAEKFSDQIKSPKETTAQSFTQIAQGTELTIIPSCDGVVFNPKHISFEWIEDIHRADFRFKADKSLSDDAARGEITIYAGPVIIGSLKFAMLFIDKETKPIEHEEHVKMYGNDDVFISYSRKDTEVARIFKNVLGATGFDVFIDVDDIRSGQLWENEILCKIERAKIFQMFWSLSYSQSENCKMEWEHALKQNKEEGYIRPVFWQQPLSPDPPEELSKINFKYVEIK